MSSASASQAKLLMPWSEAREAPRASMASPGHAAQTGRVCMVLPRQSHLRVLSTLMATAMTAVLPGACGSNGGSPGDAGSTDETESDDSGSSDGSEASASSGGSSSSEGSSDDGSGSEAGERDGTVSSGSSSGVDSGSSSSSASGTSSGYCPPLESYTVNPAVCEWQILQSQAGYCWTFEQPCSADAGSGDGGGGVPSVVMDASAEAGNPCAVCSTLVDAGNPGPWCMTGVTNGQNPVITCGSCCVGGRAPRGFVPACVGGPSARAARLARMAQVEAASVPAFRALHADLARLRAPRRILSAVRTAARDEIRHARAVGGAAERFGASVTRANVAPIAPRSIEQLAVENAEEGCIRETFGAAIAAVQAQRASDGAVRTVMRVIAREELKHAALAWDIASWLDERLDRAARARVRRARVAALRRLRAELASFGAGDPVLGLPDATSSEALLERIWEPLDRGLDRARRASHWRVGYPRTRQPKTSAHDPRPAGLHLSG